MLSNLNPIMSRTELRRKFTSKDNKNKGQTPTCLTPRSPRNIQVTHNDNQSTRQVSPNTPLQSSRSRRIVYPIIDKSQNSRYARTNSCSEVRRSLPKLYTDNVQKNVSEKLTKLREKYGTLYRNILKAHGINVDKEDLNDIMRKCQVIFQNTYSKKYFGMIDNNFGIESTRLPLHVHAQENPKLNDEEFVNFLKFTYRHNSQQEPFSPAKSPVFGSSIVESPSNLKKDDVILVKDEVEAALRKSCSIELIKSINQKEENKQEDKFALDTPDTIELVEEDKINYQLVSVRKSQATIQELGTFQTEQTPRINHSKSQDARRKSLAVLKSPEKGKSDQVIKDTKSLTNSQIINNYSLPSKALALRKKRQKATEDYIACYKTLSSAQNATEENNYPQGLSSRIRKNLVNAETRIKKNFMDELSIPEKFRTYETRAIMSNRKSYSYSKLLSSVYSKETPEDALIQNTLKMEEMRLKRDENKQAHINSMNAKKDSSRSYKRKPSRNGNIITEDDISPDRRVYFIKTSEPAANQMYNTFTRIRGKVGS